MIRIIGKFCLPEPRFSQILFPIDKGHVPPTLLTELLIHHRVETRDSWVGFLDEETPESLLT
jgi:hypothetical protein